mmetsp:Transcript_12147/g.29668  ORF Transcript_12147/g.29668 Transcript_12147/m.29668 type:complete len:788 (+) Transcript_12147:170-2533(+)
MESSQDKNLTFDIVIVGAGPSAAGLLHGFLTHILKEQVADDDGRVGKGKGRMNCNYPRIAILERGVDSSVRSTHDNDRFRHSHPATHSLAQWFSAAHYTSKPTSYVTQSQSAPALSAASSSFISSPSNRATANVDLCPSPPCCTILHSSTPQPHLNSRIMDIPTGIGWGGTTNIHAGLIMEPCYGSSRNSNLQSHENTRDREVDVKDDFDNWPGMWRGGDILRGATNKILIALRENDAMTGNSDGKSTDSSGGSVSDYSSSKALLEVCSGKEIDTIESLDWDNAKFQETVTSSSNPTNPKGNNRRMNYFSALVDPLIRKYPELESHVTFLSGVQVERVLIGGRDNETAADRNTGKHRAWAVECLVSKDGLSNENNDRILIRSRQDVIVCAGAIGSPSLLLASGIGHEDDLREAGIEPWYDQQLPSYYEGNSIHHQPCFKRLPVGHNLRDHLLLPRQFSSPLQKKENLSRNSIHGSWLLDVPMQQADMLANNTKYAKIQLQLTDGLMADSMIPHFASAALRRKWVLPFFNWEVPSAWVSYVFYFQRGMMKAMFGHPSVGEKAGLTSAGMNVCLLNPSSVGKLTLVSDGQNDSKQSIHSNSGGKVSPVRLSRCQVKIDPGYLSNPRDVDALWEGWEVTTSLKQRWFGSCKELPITTGFYLASYLVSIFRWLLMPLLGQLLFQWKKKEVEAYEKNCPAWFSMYASEFTNAYYHWCGTCAMGEKAINMDAPNQPNSDDAQDESFVVDEQLCVQGIEGLRVCDASVFPHCISAPTALTCAALGHSASTFIHT